MSRGSRSLRALRERSAAGAGTALAVAVAASIAVASRPPALVYSSASNSVIQSQPRPGTCHTIGSGPYARPDPHCTPGALNPAVTQATIGRTICASGWTATVRPPVSVSEPEKLGSMAAYGDRGSPGGYEYDHLVPLELGGATNDPRNLWPEPGAAPNPKDAVEYALNRQVCGGTLSLAQAQREIAANWVALAHQGVSGAHAYCTASARYNSTYGDYDVYVHSNQPDATVTVTGAGSSATWHTDSTGYADVYFHAAASAAGERVTVRIGAATCATAL